MIFNIWNKTKSQPIQNENINKIQSINESINPISKYEIDRKYQRGLIITDDIAVKPILDFDLYRDAIVNIIKNSYPKFTIGIFGDWGTGKTTLMNSINEFLKENENDIVRVRFETWRYEREEQFALIPLLKTIAFALPEEPKFQNLKQKLKRGAINFIKKTPDIVSSIISKNINEDVGTIAEEAVSSFKKEFNSKMELLAEVDRDTLYFDGFDDIKNEIHKIRSNNPNFKIVVFVDDLDRCSPKKTLEVLESIKVFLGMEGFIYIIGLSHDVVTKLIDIEYEKNGVKGEQYIKKIIQIPITLPKWINDDIIKLVEDLIQKEIINTKYKEIFNQKNIELLSYAIENNPREIKRFLNNFIIAYEIFSSKTNVNANELLVIQAIQLRWANFYNLVINSEDDFRKKLFNEINKYIQLDEDTRLKVLDSNEVDQNKDFDMKLRTLLRNYKTDLELWKVLEKNFDILNNMKDWNVYRRATEISKEPTEQSNYIKSHLKIFVSYSRRDAGDFATYLHKYLIEHGYDVFSDINNIRIGEPWAGSIEKNISDCDIFVVILTPASLRSPEVEKEVLEAKRKNKRIIPCIYESIEPKEIRWDLDQYQGIEFKDKFDLMRSITSKLNHLT